MRPGLGILAAALAMTSGFSAVDAQAAEASREVQRWQGIGWKWPRASLDHEAQRRLRRKRWKADKPRRIRKAKRAARKRQRS